MNTTDQKIFPLNGQDRFNYLASFKSFNAQIHAILTFQEHLDIELLKKAVRLSIEAEPILSCGVVEEDLVPFWRSFDNLDTIEWFTFVESNEVEYKTQEFLQKPLGLEGQQQLYVQLIRSVDEDVLGVKMNHASADGGGVKEYLILLAGIYTRLCQEPLYQPQINYDARRDQKNYFDTLGISEPITLFNPDQSPELPTWTFPYQNLDIGSMFVSKRRINGENYRRLLEYSKEQSVTVNTIILTSLYRSLFKLIRPPFEEEMEINVTKDLRRECTCKQTICNLSSKLSMRIPRLQEETYVSTLKRVDFEMKRMKERDSGLDTALFFEVLGVIEYAQAIEILDGLKQQAIESGKCTPFLSNMGVIQPLNFNFVQAKDAYMLTPYMYAPEFMLGVSTYKETLTLAVSYSEISTRKEDVETFLQQMYEELTEL
ncbi:MAG: hypothetical protein CVU84_09225 [Firmicutes bacterium HGW-Firmicutes-1]|jgi:NRPS condensation-like uncharacterized protein|nr:MAG: hypothetical protein CVU84_09225 [Firmicutes bacterium HGW-Firmicutes-1]